jgi:tetratricopeptide (TPR) repeat protein
VLSAGIGQAALETGNACARARELWEQLDSPSDFLEVPFGLSRYHMFRGELDLAQCSAEDLLRLSRRRNDTGGLVLGHLSSGRNLLFAGRFVSTRSHLKAGLALYDPISHQFQKVAVTVRGALQGFLGIALFCLGLPDQALAHSSEAVTEAWRLAHPPNLAGILSQASVLFALVGENAALDERASQLFAVATEQSFRYYRAQGTIFRWWATVKNGDVTEGISLLRSGFGEYRATETETWVPYYFALLARAYAIAGQIEKALTLLDDALQTAERTGERWLAAELCRHKGEMLLRQGHTEAAEELCRKALSTAVDQGAKLWELRAAVSLARLRRDQGRRAEARDLLAPVYGWFTEGFDTPDLKDAKVLLDELRG